MRIRVHTLGGMVTINSWPRQGTEVTITIPVKRVHVTSVKGEEIRT